MFDFGNFIVTGSGVLQFSANPGGEVTVQIEESEDLQTWKSAAPPAWAGPGVVTELAASEDDDVYLRLKVTSIDADGRVSIYWIRPQPGPDRGGRS